LLRFVAIAIFAGALTAFAGTDGIAQMSSMAPSPAPTVTLQPQPQGAEVMFVTTIQKDLMRRFQRTTDALRAGYFRYGNEDDTGAISYVNLRWQSIDPRHPSQLWYDVKGNLLGADFSVLQSSSPSVPHLWGIDPRRWLDFPAHVHWVIVDASGKEGYGYTTVAKFVTAGGDTSDPRAATVVALGKASSTELVKHVFTFPHIWDLIVWVKRNPDGAFADKNPLVTPSANAGKDSM
jgi:hypothetical protein